MVGVNAYTEGDDASPPTLSIDPEVERAQLRRLERLRAERSSEAVATALDRLAADAADPTVNLMPAFIDASLARATVGEQMRALEGVFGVWHEKGSA
jgi:methylmalonyl-CoA mutase N-terminal domain/subunit